MNDLQMHKIDKLNRLQTEIVQINLGNKCNQACNHCHIGASPSGRKNMDSEIAQKIAYKLINSEIENIEFTGGAPELNPNLRFFIEKFSKHGKNLTVRSNLTVLEMPDYSFYMDIYKRHHVKIVASLPGVFMDTVDKQRGKGVFQKTLNVLKKLSSLGYGTNSLCLDILYNPCSDFLPPDQGQLEKEYRKILKDKYDIYFDNLLTIVNSPVKRFKQFLKREGKLKDYNDLLKNNYNPDTLNNVMCRKLLSVDYNGNIYDCDFNLALNEKIKGYKDIKFWEVDLIEFRPEITFKEHCYACTVNMGSSCHGVLLKEDGFDVRENVQWYYGEELKQTSELKTNACCTAEALPEYIREPLALVNEEIKMKYYGCGSPIPHCVEGLNVLDVGCGTGRDAYIMSKLVGEKGSVYGIDMTENQIKLAQRYVKEQTERFGYKRPNVQFLHDYIENIERHFDEGSIDLVISNCVINLSENKETIINQIYKILRFGGEFYFSDVYADRRAPESIRKDPLLYSECLGGALYYNDFERIARSIGFSDPRIISKREIEMTNNEIKKMTGNIKFYSITYRLWKLKDLEDDCEDYGHIAVYKGTIPQLPFRFELDDSHIFHKNLPERVCGNTALMLNETRLRKYFKVIGSFEEHFGKFKNCSDVNNYAKDNNSSGRQASCC